MGTVRASFLRGLFTYNYQIHAIVTPDADAGKIFTIIYAIIACSYMAKGFRDVVCYPRVLRAKKNESKILDQFGEGLSEKKLRAILKADLLKKIPHFQRDPKQITKSEFMVLLLRMMNKLQEKDVQFASQVFDRLDSQKEGKQQHQLPISYLVCARCGGLLYFFRYSQRGGPKGSDKKG